MAEQKRNAKQQQSPTTAQPITTSTRPSSNGSKREWQRPQSARELAAMKPKGTVLKKTAGG